MVLVRRQKSIERLISVVIIVVTRTESITVINDESAGVAGAGTEVVDIEIERLHDARREKNRGAAWRTIRFLAKSTFEV